MIYYTYEIRNIRIQKSYFGRRMSKDIPDIGINYFSSSKDKEFMFDQKENPDHYKYIVLREFECVEEAIQHEIYLHKINDVACNSKCYNKVCQTSTGFDTTGVCGENHPWFGQKHTKEALEKMATNKKVLRGEEHPCYGKSPSLETRQKIRESLPDLSGKNNPFYGKTHSKETRDTISKANVGNIVSKETREKISSSSKGRKMSEEIKEKIRKTLIGRPQSRVKCPYCKVIGGIRAMHQHHFDNCKSNKG